MSFYIIPEILKNPAKVVLYGYGIEAMGFIEQFRSLGKLDNIVAIVDENEIKNNVSQNLIPIYTTQWLCSNETAFQYLVITSDITRTQTHIVEKLICSYGIPKEKILYENYEIIVEKGGILDVSNIDELIQGISRFSASDGNIGNEIEYVVKRLKKNSTAILLLKKQFEISKQFKEQILYATILMKLNVFTMKDIQKFMQYIQQSDTSKFASWKHKLLFDILPHYTMRHENDLYATFWSDSKKILDQIGGFYYDNFHPIEQKRGRIIICASKLRGAKMHIAKIVTTTANAFAKNGYKVMLLIEDHLYSGKEYFIKHKFGSGTDSEKWNCELQEMVKENVTFTYVHGIGLRERLNNTVTIIRNFQPEAVFHYMNDTTSLGYALHKIIPVVFVPTYYGGHNPYFHVLAVSNYEFTAALNKKYHFMEDNRNIIQYSRFYKKELPYHTYKKEQFGMLPHGFAVVSVGTRLAYEISNNMVDEVIYLLKRCEDIQWILVGVKKIDYINQVYAEYIENNRIIYIDYENDLPALFQICEVYLNPERAGGGISIVMAMQQGLPIAQLYMISGGATWTGTENTIKGNMHDVMEYIYQLYLNNNLYNGEKKKFKAIINNLTIENHIKSLISAKEKAIEIFNKLPDMYEKTRGTINKKGEQNDTI